MLRTALLVSVLLAFEAWPCTGRLTISVNPGGAELRDPAGKRRWSIRESSREVVSATDGSWVAFSPPKRR